MMPLPPHTRDALRTVLRELEGDVLAFVQERMDAVYHGVRPGATTLDVVTNLKGRADGAAELWAELERWALEDDPDG